MTKHEMDNISSMSSGKLAIIIKNEKEKQEKIVFGSKELVYAFRRLIGIVETECDDDELIAEMKNINKRIHILD